MFEYKFEFTKIFKFKSHSAYIIRIRRKKFFVKQEPSNRLFLVGLWNSCTHKYILFLEVVSLRSCEENNSILNIKVIWAHSPNMLNESVHILRICGMNLYVYKEYGNKVNLQMEFCYAYLLNMRNESVHILKIEYLSEFTTKIKNTLERYQDPVSLRGVFSEM